MSHLYKLLMLCVLAIFCGCGYTIGSIGHPQLQSIAIAEAENETVEANLSYLIRQHCAEEFMVDGSMKILPKSEADCILYTRILNVYGEAFARGSTNADIYFRTNTWRVSVEVEYTLVIPGRTTPLFTKSTIGRALYQVQFDQETHRRKAVEAAIREVSRNIVRQTVEGW